MYTVRIHQEEKLENKWENKQAYSNETYNAIFE